MMARFRVYRITGSRSQFDYFYPFADRENLSRRYLDGTKIGLAWEPPLVRRLYPARDQWDIAPFLGVDGLVITEHARIALGDHVMNSGIELLPLDFEGSRYWVVNILEIVDCLDLSNCVYPPDRPWSIEKYSFMPARFTRSLFKIPQHRIASPYVAEDAERPEWNFKSVVEKNKLSGIGFQLIWEDQANSPSASTQFEQKKQPLLPPPFLDLVEASPSRVVLRWPKLANIDSYSIEWSKDGIKYWTIDEILCAFDQTSKDNDARTLCAYTDKLPKSGKTFYRVRSCASNGSSLRSEPTAVVQVDLNHGNGDITA